MLIGHPVPGKRKSSDIVQAFIAGAPNDAQGHVFYGVTEGNVDAWRKARASGQDWFYCDNSYFDPVRGTQFRVTKNRLQHDGQGVSDGKRLARIRVEIERWRANVGYALVIPQSDGFMRLVAGERGDWLYDVTHSGLGPFRVRAWSSDKPKLASMLRHDLMGARLLVTYASAAAVTAVLAGVRVLCSKDCAAHCFSGGATPSDDERWRWAAVLADQQFSLEEFRDGTAWNAVNA